MEVKGLKVIPTYELKGSELDILWGGTCPKCSSIIKEKKLTESLAYWNCYECEVQFRAE